MSKFKSDFEQKVSKLYMLSMYGRWALAILSWLTLGVYAVWSLQEEIAICLDYFTWAAVYYGLHFNFLPTLCLAFCMGTTLTVAWRQIHDLIWGLPKTEKRQLEKQVRKIMSKGKSHFLWKWIDN